MSAGSSVVQTPVPSPTLTFSLLLWESPSSHLAPSQVSSASHLAQSSELAVWAPAPFPAVLGGWGRKQTACLMSHFNRPPQTNPAHSPAVCTQPESATPCHLTGEDTEVQGGQGFAPGHTAGEWWMGSLLRALGCPERPLLIGDLGPPQGLSRPCREGSGCCSSRSLNPLGLFTQEPLLQGLVKPHSTPKTWGP